MIVQVPRKIATINGLPDRRMRIVSTWAMGEDRIGIWLKELDGGSRVWPITDLDPDEIRDSWAVAE